MDLTAFVNCVPMLLDEFHVEFRAQPVVVELDLPRQAWERFF